MADRDMSQSVKELDNQLRAYKSAQARLASTVQTFEYSLTANDPGHGIVKIWADGANPNSFIGTLFASGAQVADTAAPFYDMMPIFTDDGRIGWQVCIRYADTGTITVTYKVICNQEVSLVHE